MKLEDQIFENLQLRGKIATLEDKLVESELKNKQKTEKIKALEAQIANLNMKLSFTGGYRSGDGKQRQKRDQAASKKSLLSNIFR